MNSHRRIPPPCPILYEGGGTLVVNKPPGLLTQAPAGIDSLEDQLKKYLRAQERIRGTVYLGIVHRLDRPASGAIAFSRDAKSAKRLSHQFEQRRVAKTYWAVVEGQVAPVEGSWEDHLYKVHGQAEARVVPPEYAGAKHALLHYRVLLVNARATWLEIELETGRTHQIRVQAASRGHPVWGDLQYGAAGRLGAPETDPRARTIALHARRLAFTEPRTGDPVEVQADPPTIWNELDLPLDLM